MRPVSVKFLALPSSTNITQDFGAQLSIVSLKDHAKDYPDGLTITGVYVDGLAQWTCPLPFDAVAIRPPLKQQGERVEVRCVACEPSVGLHPHFVEGSKTIQAPTPLADHRYGLQAPSQTRQRHTE